MDVSAQFPKKLLPELFRPHRYKILHGGRGSGKSTSLGKALLIMGLQKKIRVLCVRETQRSIRESVHRLLVDQIAQMGLSAFYAVQQVQITGINGTEFVFTGLSDQTAGSIQSYHEINVCWVEEGQAVSENSWTILLPTVERTEGCEVWVSFNPELDTDPTWKRFIESPAPDTWRIEMNWRDNPWFPKELDELRLHDKATRAQYDYEWIWEGKCKPAISGAVYAEQMAQLFAAGRVGDYPVEARLPVYAAFDLGWNDRTAIVVFQRQQSALRVIDYLEGSHQTLDYYSAQLRERPYEVTELFLPHDGAHNHLTGQSAERTLQDLKWTVTVLPNQPVEQGIDALRMAFKSLYIDRHCERFIECLKRYRRVIPATTREPSKPVHDEYSHGADAARYMALAAPRTDNNGGLKLPKLDYGWDYNRGSKKKVA